MLDRAGRSFASRDACAVADVCAGEHYVGVGVRVVDAAVLARQAGGQLAGPGPVTMWLNERRSPPSSVPP